MFDLVFKDRSGKQLQLSQLQGKVVLLHFWGSWCPPCMAEFPSLLKLHRALKEELGDKVEMVLMQVREPFSTALGWVEQRGFAELPIYDSMNDGGSAEVLQMSSGKSLPDRYLARVFPSSYIMDRNGIVLFSHSGPINDWEEYLPLLRHAAEHSGQ